MLYYPLLCGFTKKGCDIYLFLEYRENGMVLLQILYKLCTNVIVLKSHLLYMKVEELHVPFSFVLFLSLPLEYIHIVPSLHSFSLIAVDQPTVVHHH